MNKSIKKQLGFDSSVCDVFTETSNFRCHKKKKTKSSCKKGCNCSDCTTSKKKFKSKHPRRFSRNSQFKKKAFFKRRPQNAKAKQSTCFICKKPAHWASKCPLRSKTNFQTKIMDLFLYGYDPAEWELVENR